MCSIHFQEQLAFIIISSVRSVGIRACQNSPSFRIGRRPREIVFPLSSFLPSLLWENTVKTRKTDRGTDGRRGGESHDSEKLFRRSVVPSVLPSSIHPRRVDPCLPRSQAPRCMTSKTISSPCPLEEDHFPSRVLHLFGM